MLANAKALISTEPVSATQTVDPTASHIGNLYEFVQKQADRSSLELSFLQSKFKSLKQWQPGARAKVFEHLFYAPPTAAPQAQLVRRTDRGDYVEELPDVSDYARPAHSCLRADSQAGQIPRAWNSGAAQPRRDVSLGQRKGCRERPRASGVDRLQTKALRRQERRRRAGPPGLRGGCHRHAVLGRTAHAPGRRSPRLSRAAHDDDRSRDWRLRSTREPERIAAGAQPDDSRRDVAGRAFVGRHPHA